jgi:hypothetical protein
MANFKKASCLPPPPSAEEARDNVKQPERAPAADTVDGRSPRATGRTEQLATRVTPQFHRDLKVYATERGLKIVEVLEQAFEALKRQKREYLRRRRHLGSCDRQRYDLAAGTRRRARKLAPITDIDACGRIDGERHLDRIEEPRLELPQRLVAGAPPRSAGARRCAGFHIGHPRKDAGARKGITTDSYDSTNFRIGSLEDCGCRSPILKTGEPPMAKMSALRRRMIEDMTVRNLSPATQRSYVHAVAKFGRGRG